MILFMQIIEGESLKWFRTLLPNGINKLDRLVKLFLQYFDVNKSNKLWLTKFFALKLKDNELVSDFSKIFTNCYNLLPSPIRPSETAKVISYSPTIDDDFPHELEEREPYTLANAQPKSFSYERNLIAIRKKLSQDSQSDGKKKVVDTSSQVPSSSSS